MEWVEQEEAGAGKGEGISVSNVENLGTGPRTALTMEVRKILAHSLERQ